MRSNVEKQRLMLVDSFYLLQIALNELFNTGVRLKTNLQFFLGGKHYIGLA